MIKLFSLNWIASLIEFCTLGFSGGGGGSTTSTGTTYTSNIPEYAQPFYEEGMKQAAKQVFTTDAAGNVTGIKPYTPYTGERVAGFDPAQIDVQNQILGMTMNPAFAQAQAGLKAGRDLGYGASVSGLNQAFAYDPRTIMADRVRNMAWSPEAAAYYADPYQQGVTDIAVREARRQGDIEKEAGALGAIKRGTFGGARQGLMQAEQQRNLAQNIADIRTKGAQSAYENAQKQFLADQENAMKAQQLNQAAGLQAQQLTQQGEQYAAGLGKDIGLAGLNANIEAAKNQAAAAATEQTAQLEQLKAKAATAAEKQALQQRIDDIKYQTFMEQQNWGKAQLEFYNAMLHGTPGLAQTQVQYAPSPSAASQIGGLGLGALGLMKALG
jgi:hypothetical protein